jgi:hypothetical protein
MNKNPAVSYDLVFRDPVEERIRIFNEITAENRALLIKTHAERWLSMNRQTLTREQTAVVEELIESISPEWYREGAGSEVIAPDARAMISRIEAVLPREDIRQLATNYAEYIPRAGETDDN